MSATSNTLTTHNGSTGNTTPDNDSGTPLTVVYHVEDEQSRAEKWVQDSEVETKTLGFGDDEHGKGLPIGYEQDNVLGPGLQGDGVYDTQMSPWRAGIRRMLVKNLGEESRILSVMQERIRTPLLDTYFVYTSSLGTHTFFMTVLPAFFFFGHDVTGRGLLHVIGVGVYLSSLIKDSVCSPRPFAPPVTRLTMGSHHLEYGFPSTHSTNSVSIALQIHTLLQLLFVSGAISLGWLRVGQVALVWYAISIVFGRLYCAMHSFTDCVFGVFLGTSVWATQYVWGDSLEKWMTSDSLQVPLFTIPLCLFLVHAHAEPVDDCPCFEDAIAFVSVLLGSTVSRWHMHRLGLDQESGYFQARMPDSWFPWMVVAGAKMGLGIFIIFAWRLLAKSILHVVLPPIIRFASHLFTLPNRRFYTPATDYETVPPEEDGGLLGLKRPIPSVIDLPAMRDASKGMYVLPSTRPGGEGLKLRNGKTGGKSTEVGLVHSDRVGADGPGGGSDVKVKHYDADVLTKVIVYAGIAYLATGLVPVLFEVLGWGVLSGPI